MRWRTGRHDPARAWTSSQAAAAHAASVQRVLALLVHRFSQDAAVPALHAQLLSELRSAFATPEPLLESTTSTNDSVHVLVFDGGSRGNPGPGGSGACIVRVDVPTGTSTIVWSAAMSHGHSSTTNNQAEYRGLLRSLRAAHRHQWAPLEVVGDSDLIIRQHLFYRPPKNACLLHLYAEMRRLADQLGVVRWTHHVRAFNKMADSLANYAMDTRTSSQTLHPTALPGHADIRTRLSNDLDPWLPAFLGRHVE